MGDEGHSEPARQFIEPGTRQRIIVAMLIVIDLFTLALATLTATYVRFNMLAASAGFENISTRVSYYDIAWIAVGISLLFLWREGLYDIERLFWGSGEFSRVIQALALGVVAFILATYALHIPGLSRAWTVLAFALSVVFVSAGRMCVRVILRSLRRRGRLLRRTLIVGSNAEAAQIARLLKKAIETGLVPIGCLAPDHAEHLNLDFSGGEVPCLGEAGDLASIVREHQIDTVVIVSSAFDHDIVSWMIGELRGADVTTHVSSGLFEILTQRMLVRELAGVPFILVKGVSFSRVNLFVKRMFDLLVAGTVVLIGLPIWIALAASVKLSSPGPVFFKQARTGRGGREFMMFKFRSMHADAPELHAQLAGEANEADGPIFKMKNDPRVTPNGRFMRKFSLDEFPQLLNVLKGEMSLVGPRPLPTYETKDLTPEQNRRLEVPPGLTGMWQVSGRSTLTFDEMVQLDLYYIENWSVLLDLSLIARTVPVLLFPEGAY